MSFEILYKDLCEAIIACNANMQKFNNFIKDKYNLSESESEAVTKNVQRNFIHKFQERYKKCHSIKARFMDTYASWLLGIFAVPISSNQVHNTPEKSSRGRPEKEFESCSSRAKRYKVQNLRESYPEELINMASKNTPENLNRSFIPTDRALSIIIESQLSTFQYESLRNELKMCGYNILPPYYMVLEEKKKCYPKNLSVTETKASVDLQDLLDHTAERILKTKKSDEILKMEENVVLTCKWGCDGASSQSEYHQSFQTGTNLTDSHLYMGSIVPLLLESNKNTEYWKNNCPSSTRYCRPIFFEFVKETKEQILTVVNDIKNEIYWLEETKLTVNNKTFKVKHNLIFCMIDGKTAQVVTETPSPAVCYICKSKPTEMNNLEMVHKKVPNVEAYAMGLSPLHARIKFMECILHLGYNLSFKKWSVSNVNHKVEKESNKKRIQQAFRDKAGLLIDKVKPGSGTSNDGNTSRKFFSNPALASEITGVNEELIDRFRIILQAITCGHQIDASKFDMYAQETAKLFVKEYGTWYYMPVTVHKVLMHGKQIIETALLPVGMLSEEAEEARNKDFRKYRQMFSRKMNRVSTNEDVFHRLLISSDPYLTSMRKRSLQKVMALDDEVKNMLVE